jgi:hypothetical protein
VYPFLLSKENTPAQLASISKKPGAVFPPGSSRSFGEYALLEDSRYMSQEASCGDLN